MNLDKTFCKSKCSNEVCNIKLTAKIKEYADKKKLTLWLGYRHETCEYYREIK